VGVLNMPTPQIGAEAWHRLTHGSRTYAITGITHTTATAKVMDVLPGLLVAPLEDYDALICTSSAVRIAVETQLDMMRRYLRELHGPRTCPEPQRVIIPLGVNAADFTPSPEHRKAWRERLDIPDDAVVALYVGRFTVKTKMNPALMAMALERAARRTERKIYWVNSGWIEPASAEESFHGETRKLCPSVEYRVVDGRPADTRFSIWSVADFFLSLSDNIQETFGLTPVEAMAAGLPSVVSDWDGYKDTVRDGIDGCRVPTIAPRPGFGGDLASWVANNWMSYDNYVGAVAQYTAVDLAAAEAAILALVDDPEKRRTMGEAARRQAQAVFDWSAIIPRYQALWAEQDARRRAAAPVAHPRANPYRPDPYTLFGNYPSRNLQRTDMAAANPERDWAAAKARLEAPLAEYSRMNRPTPEEVEAVFAALAARGPMPVAQLLAEIPTGRRSFVERGLLWMARHDLISIRPA
jgi:glycosyltransferase involved in cell wall biosynthesis